MVYQELEPNCREIMFLDLQRDRATATGIGIASFLVMAVMAVGMALLRPIRALFDMSGGVGVYALRFFCVISGNILLSAVHECVQGLIMKKMGAQSVRHGWNGMNAWAGSELDYFDRCSYYLVCLAPLAVFSCILCIGCSLAPADWFWVLYLILIGNVAGSVGDIFVVLKLIGIRGKLRIRDTGSNITVYQVEI